MTRTPSFVMTSVTRAKSARPRTVGLIVFALAVTVMLGVFQKERIATTVRDTDTVVATFERSYKLDPYRSDVKLAGVIVGTVSGVEHNEDGTANVSMELDDGVAETLGEKPSAAIRPTLLLGGRYYVDLVPGGEGSFDAEGPIPVERTRLPVELDRVLSAFTPAARESVPRVVERFDKTLQSGGREALRSLVEEAPGTLRPGADVLRAARGSRPNRDLTDLVSGLESFASAVTEKDGELDTILSGLADTSDALADVQQPVSQSIATSANTLRVTRAGLADLRPTLNRLEKTADRMRPTAAEADDLLEALAPALEQLRPLVDDLRPTLREARPLVERLVPTSQQATSILNDLDGPVLDRVNGPILSAVNERWSGSGPYDGGGGNGHRTYEELGYLFHNASSAFGYQGPNGTLTRLTAGVGINSVGGSGITLQKYLEMITAQGGVR